MIPLKAVIYCRVSTKEQVEEGNSLKTQERICYEFAIKHGYEVAEVFIEEGESAKTADRTELQKLLRFCSDKKQHINAVIIYKIDRLSRNTDDYSQIRLLLKRYGIEIKSTSEFFENTPAGRFMENIIANVAQFDNDVRTERSVGGMKDAVREGRYVWQAPVGYKNIKVNGKASIGLSDEAPLVKKLFEMMADRNQSVNQIYDLAVALGLRTRNGNILSKSGFYVMLKNELYTGWIIKFGERNLGEFTPIISRELFRRVQQAMGQRHPAITYKKENPDFPLRRFIRNPDNIKLTGAWSKGRLKYYPYYRFPNTSSYWPKSNFESLFYNFLDEYTVNKETIDTFKQQLLTQFHATTKKQGDQIKEISLLKEKFKEKQHILIQKNLKGFISDILLQEQLSIIDKEIWDLDKLSSQNENTIVDVTYVLEFISEFLQSPSATWKNLPFEIKVKLLWFQFPEGVIFDGKRFGTTEVVNIFKVKSPFLTKISSKVPNKILNYEHSKQANFSPLSTKESIAWKQTRQKLVELEQILNFRKETNI